MSKKRRVKLKVYYTDKRGGGNVPGENVALPWDVAERMIKEGTAVPLDSIAVPADHTGPAPRNAPVTKPLEGISLKLRREPAEPLKGATATKWYRDRLTAAGIEPVSNKLADVRGQWEAHVDAANAE